MGVNPFHMVSKSPWPLLGSMCGSSLLLGVYYYLCYASIFVLYVSVISLFLISFLWWRDVIRESTYQGSHTSVVSSGLYTGFLFFVLSEVMFFFSFFFSFFFLSLVPSVELGGWPPVGIEPMSYIGIPLFNTILLISSGVSITWAHHNLLSNNSCLSSLLLTIMMGILFLFYQIREYYESSFSMADSVFGSIFFLTTGFHGLHVLIGVTFLMVVWIRLFLNQMSKHHHVGFEVSSWYWHFVDVIWLFLFVVV
nr:cytochrome c oxidase subunit 3 [Alcedoecus sp.]